MIFWNQNDAHCAMCSVHCKNSTQNSWNKNVRFKVYWILFFEGQMEFQKDMYVGGRIKCVNCIFPTQKEVRIAMNRTFSSIPKNVVWNYFFMGFFYTVISVAVDSAVFTVNRLFLCAFVWSHVSVAFEFNFFHTLLVLSPEGKLIVIQY